MLRGPLEGLQEGHVEYRSCTRDTGDLLEAFARVVAHPDNPSAHPPPGQGDPND